MTDVSTVSHATYEVFAIDGFDQVPVETGVARAVEVLGLAVTRNGNQP